MPKILHNLVQKLKGHSGGKLSESSRWAIATAALQKQGKLKKGSQKLTAKGRKASK